MDLAIQVWYLAPQATSPSSSITATSISPIPPQYSTPQQAVPTLTLVGARKRDNKKGKKVEASNTPSSRVPQPCSLCEKIGHPINMRPELNELKYLLHAPKVLVNPPPHVGENSTRVS